MAYNAASHNIAGIKTGPATGPPPSLSEDAKTSLVEASENDPTGQSAPDKIKEDQSSDTGMRKEQEDRQSKASAKEITGSEDSAIGATGT
ncbi:hypothetical protein M501DRAFT_1018609 [Patellaria atrata CBS 101060]|uniref:Uncharacterized protein n=1 Tax=Patellaria atrata CBS 101060 TaxID=1346257 RepID=A0A9P4S6C4_9PEZI|nr:hypothetical protein M501DRAFT_1018609 [Patellaria atrata CBS 101060]